MEEEEEVETEGGNSDLGSGTIPSQSVETVIRSLGKVVTEKKLTEILNSQDVDGEKQEESERSGS